MKLASLALAFALLAAPALAQPSALDPFRPARPSSGTADRPDPRFVECTNSIEADPVAAYERAMAWAGEARAMDAYRCAAMALVAQERYEEAGRRFESLATNAEGQLPTLRAELLEQAGNSYMLARLPARARSAFTMAITLVQSNRDNLPDLLIDRASAYALERDWRHSEEDLSRSLDIRSNDALALRLRAIARMNQNAFDLAVRDAEEAVRLEPTSVDARVTLGDMREAQRTRQITVR